MKKLIQATLKIIMCGVLILGFFVVGIGYKGYKETVSAVSIKETICEIKQDKDFVALQGISQDFLDSIVAVEDHRFYEHGALDVISITRATLKNLLAGEVVQGGSTITQQLAKNLFLTQDQTFMRKLKEMFIAYELEKDYSKEEILELYVNVIYYGDGYTGIRAASKGYFEKEPSQLSYEEATLLAGLPQAPSRYALSKHYDKALVRQQQVVLALSSFQNK